MNTENRPIVGVASHICHNGKVLAFQRIGSHDTGTWSVMGGHMEHGENWAVTAMREAREEVGIETHSPKLFAVTNDIFPESGKHYLTLHVELKADTENFTNAEPDKHQQLGWYAWENIPEPRMLPVQQLFDQNQKPDYL